MDLPPPLQAHLEVFEILAEFIAMVCKSIQEWLDKRKR